MDTLSVPGAYLLETLRAGGNRTLQVILPLQNRPQAGSNVTDWGGFMSLFFISHEGVAQREIRTRIQVYANGRGYHLDYDDAQTHSVILAGLRHPHAVPRIDPAVGLSFMFPAP
jgi:hypothetical protein